MQAPLQLERYFFTKVVVGTNTEFRPSDMVPGQPIDVDLSLTMDLAKNPNDPNKFQLTLSISKIVGKNFPLPYDLDLQAVGLFTIDSSFNHPNMDRLVQVSGGSILYSAAREFVLLITSRGPWHSFQLPTITLQSVLADKSIEKTSS